MNIVDLISSQLTGDVLGKLGGLVGGTQQQTQSASAAAVPALLQVFGKMVSTQRGADQLARSMGGLDLSMLGNLAGLLGGGNASSLANTGGSILGQLLGGGSNLTRLAGLLASFVGSQPGMMQKLLTYLAPVVLGVVAKQFTGRPDAAGVQRLFSEQASNISGALPKGLSLGDVASFFASEPEPAARATSHGQRHEPSHGHRHEPASSGFPSWLLPLLALAALGVGAYLFTRPKPEEKRAVAVTETKVGPVTDRVTEVVEERGNQLVDTVQEVLTIDPRFLEAVRVGTTATELFGGLTKTLSGVTDEASARAALPKLEGFGPLLETLETETARLPAEEKPALTEFLGKNLSLLQKVINTALAIPGVRNILGSAVTPMVETLTRLAK